MNSKELLEAAIALRARIAELPGGYVSRKTINGKERFYLQWREDGKLKSKYLKAGEKERIEPLIEERKALQQQLKDIEKSLHHRTDAGGEAAHYALAPLSPSPAFETNVITGQRLLNMAKGVLGWQKRDCYSLLEGYIRGPQEDRVCLMYGLRRTGKTTLLKQLVLDLSAEDQQRSAYIKITQLDSLAALNRDLRILSAMEFKYVFIDEVTLLSDFIESASLFSDIYASQGMKIVLTGTDSLGFWFAEQQELYDRALTVHTTFIPYREHSRLLDINDIDEYIRFGGTLRAGELDFDDTELLAPDASFRDDESTRRYIDTAISRNIQRSLEFAEDGGHFRHLKSLYVADELTNAINRIIEDMSHDFLASVITRDFISHDLRLGMRNLRKEHDPERRTLALESINEDEVTQNLMRILDIRGKERQLVEVTETHVSEVRTYLEALDLIIACPIETEAASLEPLERILFTQPGMRFCQAQALVHSIMQDASFRNLSERERRLVTQRILDDVRGRMLEDIVLLETLKAAPAHERVLKLQFAAGEFDMVIYDAKRDECRVFEVKHSLQRTPEQYRHLIDAQKCAQTERRFGPIVERTVLYRGESAQENNVRYQNVEEYLNSLARC